MDSSYTLCVLCCCSFNGSDSSTICRQDLLNFFNLLLQSPPQDPPGGGGGVGNFNGHLSSLSSILENSSLSICSDCHAFITVALETRSRAEQMEENVRSLQQQILEGLRSLQQEMEIFHQEMTKIESVVKTSDETCLLFHMPRETQRPMEESNGVLVLRERILDVVTDLRIYQVSCKADARLPVDEMEVEAMWEDAQQLVQCTPDIHLDYPEEEDHEILLSTSSPSPFLGGDDPTGGNLYLGHSLQTRFYLEGESSCESDGGSLPPPNKNFKQDVIRRALARETTRTPEQNSSPDPLRRFYLKWSERRSELSVGSIPVLINEQDETLQCSQCSIMGKRSKSNHQSKQNWRDMEKGILVHIIGKHLGGFKCQHCNDVFTSHTMIKKHVSKEHAGQNPLQEETTPPPPPPPPPPPSPPRRKPYACSMCSSAFSKPSLLKRHFLAKHAKNSEITIAAPSPSTPPGPQRKKKQQQGQGQAAPSPSGGSGGEKIIPTKSAQRPHECHVCKYAFTKGSHLKRHLEVHRKRNELF